MGLFKRIFGHERSESGKSLDRLVLTVILAGVAIGFYACSGKSGAEPMFVKPQIIDGVEYLLRYGKEPRQGWQNGLNSYETRKVCEVMLGLLDGPSPVVCMVRKALPGGRDT